MSASSDEVPAIRPTSTFFSTERRDVELALECLRQVELEHKANVRADQLSGGSSSASASRAPSRRSRP